MGIKVYTPLSKWSTRETQAPSSYETPLIWNTRDWAERQTLYSSTFYFSMFVFKNNRTYRCDRIAGALDFAVAWTSQPREKDIVCGCVRPWTFTWRIKPVTTLCLEPNWQKDEKKKLPTKEMKKEGPPTTGWHLHTWAQTNSVVGAWNAPSSCGLAPKSALPYRKLPVKVADFC